MTNNEFLRAAQGTKALNSADSYSGKFAAIIVPSSVSISVLKVNGHSPNEASKYMTTVDSAIEGWTMITPQDGDFFSDITTTAGQCTLILGKP